MNKHTIITILLALVAVAGQAKTYKRIIAPEAMASVNCELTADEVVFTDTATTVRFTKKGDPRYTFRIISSSYLMDEDGNRYLLRSAEGIRLDEWVATNADSINHFTMHFEPMPKRVKVFDFIEGDVRSAFMLLGIHDKKTKLKAPTLKELSDAYPWTVPDDWFKTDTVCIRGRIEGYDAEQFGFTSLEGFVDDVFMKENGMMVIDIAPDGSFEKQFMSSYPVSTKLYAKETKVGFDEIPFFARPGETIDITIRRNAEGYYECVYHNGSSHEVERWLGSKLMTGYLSNQLALFHGSFSDATMLAEEVWQNMLYRIGMVSRRDHFTPMEVQLALSDAQLYLASAFLDYAMTMKYNVRKQVDGVYYDEIVDRVNWKELSDANSYTPLHRIDFDNPLMMSNDHLSSLVNRVQYATPAVRAYFSATGQKQLDDYYAVLREMLGSKDNTLMAQLCLYQQMLTEFRNWRTEKERTIEALKNSPNLPDSLRERVLNSIPTVESKYTMVSNTFTHPYVKDKADEFYRRTMAQTELSAPIPDAPMADLIRSLCAKYPGKILMIDFWDMGCGPCRYAIQESKELRAKIAKRDDVKLIFIAGERTTDGSDAYKKYVAEWLADEETVCLTNADFTRLQELFHFSGIPHYETITPDGRIVRDGLLLRAAEAGFDRFILMLEEMKAKLEE